VAFGTVQTVSCIIANDKGEWRTIFNNYLHTLYEECDIVSYVKIICLKWAGHVIGMEEQTTTRRVLVAAVEGRRQRGRLKLSWEDGVTEVGVEKLEECCKE